MTEELEMGDHETDLRGLKNKVNELEGSLKLLKLEEKDLTEKVIQMTEIQDKLKEELDVK